MLGDLTCKQRSRIMDLFAVIAIVLSVYILMIRGPREFFSDVTNASWGVKNNVIRAKQEKDIRSKWPTQSDLGRAYAQAEESAYQEVTRMPVVHFAGVKA